MEVINIKSLKRMDHVSSNTRTKNKRKVQVAHTCVMRSETRRDEMDLSRKPAKQKSKGKFMGAEKKRKQKKKHTHRERERERESA